jgi:endonuclease YncB( thermonuclease family)
MPTHLIPSDYLSLREEVVRLLLSGRARAQQAVEREKAQTYWEIGRRLHAHVLANKARADYGEQVMARLAEDVKINQRVLYEMLEFHRAFPILRSSAKLTWTHYRRLTRIPAKAERRFYAQEAARSGWTVQELEDRIRADVFRKGEKEAEMVLAKTDGPPLSPKRGRLYTYRLLRRPTAHGGPGEVRLDLGFEVHLTHALDGASRPGAVVESVREEDGYRLQASRAGQGRLYTYRAVVEEVIDGDTLRVEIDCGFRVWVRQKLRLRGIDAPEMPGAAGRRAKAFVERALSAVPFVVLTTTRPDKYDRYLSDLFYLPGATDPQTVLNEGQFLNQQLLDEGLAVRFQT